MPIFVKTTSDDVRSGRKAKARHSWLKVAQESMGLSNFGGFHVPLDQVQMI